MRLYLVAVGISEEEVIVDEDWLATRRIRKLDESRVRALGQREALGVLEADARYIYIA